MPQANIEEVFSHLRFPRPKRLYLVSHWCKTNQHNDSLSHWHRTDQHNDSLLLYLLSAVWTMRIKKKKHSSAWFSLLGWFETVEPDPEQPIADIFKLGISLEKDFFLTITKTKLRAWLHWNSFTKYPLLLLQEWILLTEKKTFRKRKIQVKPIHPYRISTRWLNNIHSQASWWAAGVNLFCWENLACLAFLVSLVLIGKHADCVSFHNPEEH